jgi:hypothetical protein
MLIPTLESASRLLFEALSQEAALSSASNPEVFQAFLSLFGFFGTAHRCAFESAKSDAITYIGRQKRRFIGPLAWIATLILTNLLTRYSAIPCISSLKSKSIHLRQLYQLFSSEASLQNKTRLAKQSLSILLNLSMKIVVKGKQSIRQADIKVYVGLGASCIRIGTIILPCLGLLSPRAHKKETNAELTTQAEIL